MNIQTMTELIPLSQEVIIQILVAALLGGIVGLERVWSGHPAGLRTNMLIAISSCLFTILSIKGFPFPGTDKETTHIAAQIVTGVGFLGAGAIFHNHSSTAGFTTAASIWLVAAIGMACGSGNISLAVFVTATALVVLAMLAPISNWIARHPKYGRKERD
jgi:putative Mg2+ transporter-C (MgtC) family protein